MRLTKRWNLGENMFYTIVWLFIFLIPLMHDQLMSEHDVDLNKMIISWGKIAPYFLIFLLNNILLAPRLLLNHRYIWYSGLLLSIIFVIFGCIEIFDFRYWQSDIDLRNKASFTDLEWYWNVVLGVLMAGANSMIKLYYRTLDTDRHMAQLEKQNIETQMEYLKYQINPHFLMNTLNNIHAMIDFDSDKAKDSVMELSRMLRHILYDSSESLTTLESEVSFLNSYIDLMRIRYVDEVDIRITTPNEAICRRISLPPLLLIVLVENAFKHGISYNHKSFIDINIEADDTQLKCVVSNSYHPTYGAKHSGIGLNNITKRLQLLYGNNHQLTVDNSNGEIYTVTMVIPITK